MTYKLPESYRAYCADVAVQTAVDHILAAADSRRGFELPANIDWKELPAFHRALLSAHQVRCEYAVHLLCLWDAVWQPALVECDFAAELEPWAVADAQGWLGHNFDAKTVWEKSWLIRVSDIVDTNIRLGLGIFDGTGQVQLSFSLRGQDDADHMTGRHFGDDWPMQLHDEGWAWTTEGLAAARDDGTIDVDPLRRAAAGALASVFREFGV